MERVLGSEGSAGQRWPDVLERELDAAKCVVVLWSEASVASRWVKVEASEALEMEKLVPARIEKVRPPLGYRDIEAADLREWTPGSPGAEYDQLVDAVSGLVEESTGESVSGFAEPALAPPQLLDPGTVIEVRTLEGHTSLVRGVAVTPDGRHIVSGSDDRTVKVWDLASGEEVRTLEGHTRSVEGVSVTPDGRHIVSGSGDETVKVWDLASGEEVRTLEGHTSWVRGVVTPDGRHIVSGSGDRTVKVWDLTTKSQLPEH